ncbi:hypothetical protein J27TS7_22490 [Paenibacillus dendritiformis]|uniref:histidine kinase dimerization/phospho-acceptor domain-containing protein n=1 Tax=Paenibacillus dendritiformis TaxID=130049 RepID=UPI001B094460|nr:histidine kinase dimerization/phospho-acceptor domain-containing protein [Paenibacillus dendritiformis]GIO72735.1 hypothetical protein J27TS7_22490 [Paenibacillus dendritiformis]
MTSRLKQLEQIRTDLLAGVSHELRTPLTSIRGMVQPVHGRVVAGNEADEFLQISLEEAKRMQSMVDDLLEFSSLEAGAITALPAHPQHHSAVAILAVVRLDTIACRPA